MNKSGSSWMGRYDVCDLSQLHLGLGALVEVQVRGCWGSEEGEVVSDRACMGGCLEEAVGVLQAEREPCQCFKWRGMYGQTLRCVWYGCSRACGLGRVGW